MMNKQRIIDLADAIEAGIPDLQFNMRVFCSPAPNCETYACIAGHAVALFAPEVWSGEERQTLTIAQLAADLLQLAPDEESLLFYPQHSDADWDITKAQAVATLRHFAATGRIDWHVEDPNYVV